MHFSSNILLLGAASAVAAATSGQRLSMMAIRSVFERQVDTCVPVTAPATCERSCGPGNIECISFPTCYNPSAGESCCSNGKYCPSGFYCTDAGCCPNGTPLADCGATISLSVILPPAPTTAAPVPTGTLTTTAELTRTPESTTSTTSTTSSTTSESSTESTTSTSSTKSSTSSSSTTTQSASSTTSSGPIQVTPNAALKLGSDGLPLVLGLGALIMAL
ncbi:Prp 4 [Rhexocercosporidium sp. MPI-PUGE-AT-0058]|nr:Prp 4 [Rhexocercosporidium sp. MPI-PUGE-AT-0058]